jgi:hypothetical protein
MAITADNVNWKLSEIRSKVRRLTGRPSINQISDDEVDKYINRFYTQDLVALLHLDDLGEWWTFETMVNLAKYSNNSANYTLEGPAYINGDPITIFRDSTAFRDRYPLSFKTRENVGSGDGATATFSGTLAATVISPEEIVFDDDVEALRVQPRGKVTNVTQANPAVVTTDVAHGLTTGDTVKMMNFLAGMVELNNIQTTITSVSATTFQLDNIDSSAFTAYTGGGEVLPISVAILKGDQGGSGRVTLSSGAYSITFNSAPADGQELVASYKYSTVGRPVAALLYGSEVAFSPIPDGSYLVEIGVSARPTPLLADTDALVNDDWGKLVAYGASIDILSDFGQQQEASLLGPQFRQYQLQAQRRDLKNNRDERAFPRF